MSYIPTARERYLELCAEPPAPAPTRQLPDILGDVARAAGVERQALAGRSRAAGVVAARHAAMLVLRERWQLSLVAIGALLGRDHTTVLHGLKAAQARRRHDPAYAARLNALLRKGGAQ